MDSLMEGNVITVEPGIYVPPASSLPTHFHNLGIRIEVRLTPVCYLEHESDNSPIGRHSIHKGKPDGAICERSEGDCRC